MALNFYSKSLRPVLWLIFWLPSYWYSLCTFLLWITRLLGFNIHWMAHHLRFSFVKTKYYIETFLRALQAVVLTSGSRCCTCPDTVVVGLYDCQKWTQIIFLEDREQEISRLY